MINNYGCPSEPLLARKNWTLEAAAQRQKPSKNVVDRRLEPSTNFSNNFSNTKRGYRDQGEYLSTSSQKYMFDDQPNGVEFKYSNVNHQISNDGRSAPMTQDYREEGPFVFGSYSPNQFPISSQFQPDNTYEFAYEGDNKSVIENNETKKLYCDKKVHVKPRTKQGEPESKTGNLNNKTVKSIKCVLLGDGAVGKTSLIKSYAQNKFQPDYKPTTYDSYNAVVYVDQKPVRLDICDTPGEDILQGIRELCYPGTDVIMLCFSVVKPESFRSIENRWAPGSSALKAPFILIGTQSDLRDNYKIINDLEIRGERPISEAEAKSLASKLNATYIETSSKNKSRLKDAFDSVILAAMPFYKKKKPLWKQLLCLS